MEGELIRVGDEVIITIPKENRDWGCNPCPDGSKATVLGFSEIHYGRLTNCDIKPGVYTNYYWVKLRIEDGRELTVPDRFLELSDKSVYEQRLEAFQKYQRENPDNWYKNEEFIRELPDTPFCEGDLVCVRDSYLIRSARRNNFQVMGIDYDSREKIMYWLASDISHVKSLIVYEDDIELVEHGSVWKKLHNKE